MKDIPAKLKIKIVSYRKATMNLESLNSLMKDPIINRVMSFHKMRVLAVKD